MAIRIVVARRAARQIRRDVPREVWERIVDDMEQVFKTHSPDQAYGETIKPLVKMKSPTFRFKSRHHSDWRAAYDTEAIFIGKRVVIFCCLPRDVVYKHVRKFGVKK